MQQNEIAKKCRKVVKGRDFIKSVCEITYPNDPKIVTPPWQLWNALPPKRTRLVRIFLTEWWSDLEYCSVKKSPHRSSLFSRESIWKFPGRVSLFVGRWVISYMQKLLNELGKYKTFQHPVYCELCAVRQCPISPLWLQTTPIPINFNKPIVVVVVESVLLSANAKRVGVSCMQDILLHVKGTRYDKVG